MSVCDGSDGYCCNFPELSVSVYQMSECEGYLS